MDREAIKLNMFLGKTNSWEYVFIDEEFKYKDWMYGLTYSVFQFATEDELEKLKEDYYSSDDAYDMFIEYIKYHKPRNMSYDDWSDMAMSESDYPFDDSYSNEFWLTDIMAKESERIWEDLEYSNCIWWWRLWKDSEYSDKNNYEYINEENFEKFLKLLPEYEK